MSVDVDIDENPPENGRIAAVTVPVNGPLLLRSDFQEENPSTRSVEHSRRVEYPSFSVSGLLKKSSTNRLMPSRLSRNIFFVRHCPQPRRVKKLMGLLNEPINNVFETNELGTKWPQLTFPRNVFPPDSHNQAKLQRWFQFLPLPGQAVNVNSKLYPINTITGAYLFEHPVDMPWLKYFKSIPPHFSAIDDAWSKEIRLIADYIGLPIKNKDVNADVLNAQPLYRSKTCLHNYSETTGRLIPTPPGRFTSREPRSLSQMSSRASNDTPARTLDEQELEQLVLVVLQQLLQVPDPLVAQKWLLSASEQERALVIRLVHAAVSEQIKPDNSGGSAVVVKEVAQRELSQDASPSTSLGAPSPTDSDREPAGKKHCEGSAYRKYRSRSMARTSKDEAETGDDGAAARPDARRPAGKLPRLPPEPVKLRYSSCSLRHPDAALQTPLPPACLAAAPPPYIAQPRS